MKSLFAASSGNTAYPVPVSAGVKVFCSGESISLVIEVKDAQIQSGRTPAQSDHIEVSFALPPSAYPPDFNYAQHPQYVTGRDLQYRSGISERVFTLAGDRSAPLRPDELTDRYGYPSPWENSAPALVPDPVGLRKEEIHFGLVQFALFPDGRAAVQLNQRAHEPLRRYLESGVGNIAQGIRYSSEPLEHDRGYLINAEFSPQALGFIQLPRMNQIRMLVRVADMTDGRQTPVYRLTSSPQGNPGQPATFNTVYFDRPLYTNCTEAPDRLFEQASFYPVYMLSESGWISTFTDVDALRYRPGEASANLAEVRFSQSQHRYQNRQDPQMVLQSLTVREFPANEPSREREYILVNHQHLAVSDRLLNYGSGPYWESFRYPDGKPGLLIRNSYPYDPYQPASQQNTHEKIAALRLDSYGLMQTLSILQDHSPEGGCTIQDLRYSQFDIGELRWFNGGEFLVALITHRSTGEVRRIKIAWRSEAGRFKIEEIR
ncbi:MAG: hypothetical protein NW241_20950 [Bacteroidia bacterium]|nr:hypothetical protein [Bacteroidia bacterium]